MSRLRLSAEAAEAGVVEVISKGRSLLRPATRATDVDSSDRKHNQWIQVTRTMLAATFDTLDEVGRYDAAFPEEPDFDEDDEEYVERRIHCLPDESCLPIRQGSSWRQGTDHVQAGASSEAAE
jgi:hypothetical protein